ncbi:hypothetical protein [Lysinibacillus sp. BW-2-10]|uniref:hypothetical protein n=1 Tax=Lysinibacillus sp. BW-2-10 TaxID=2590030 RepID=UPI00117F4EA3|nr:hypothetical protein [Lysinibacillus sp. BW-2-10]TSI04648.1 hypothetical protein FJQ64_13905 [Lysinibacillus sp. BW-2-10]
MAKKCVECEKEVTNYIPLYKRGTICGDEEDYSKRVICNHCLKISEDYAYCCCCGNDGAYSIKDLLTDEYNWYCKEHISESILETEEEDNWLNYLDYINDPSH